MWRLFKNTFWYIVIMAIGVMYYQLFPTSGIELYLGFIPLGAVTYVVISYLRSKFRF